MLWPGSYSTVGTSADSTLDILKWSSQVHYVSRFLALWISHLNNVRSLAWQMDDAAGLNTRSTALACYILVLIALQRGERPSS